jgi:hypothetical protein
MPVLTPSQKLTAKVQYKKFIHNFTTSVRKASSSTSVQPDPRIHARDQVVLKQWDDFKCSMFHFLSGKTDRLLQERSYNDLVAQLGIVPDRAIVVQYVCDEYIRVPNPLDDPVIPVLNNLTVNDEILYSGEWFIIKTVIPDSEGIQHTAFACK